VTVYITQYYLYYVHYVRRAYDNDIIKSMGPRWKLHFHPKTDGWSRKQCVERYVSVCAVYAYVELIARDQCEPNRSLAVVVGKLCYI